MIMTRRSSLLIATLHIVVINSLIVTVFAMPSPADPISTFFPTDGWLVEDQDQYGRYIDNLRVVANLGTANGLG